jgi:hypothetical protein
MRLSRIRATTALGLLAGTVMWTASASPATASGGAGWREEGHFDTQGACRKAGQAGVEKSKWDEYKCRPGRSANYVTLWVRGGGARFANGPAAG